MNTPSVLRRSRGFTLIELLVVITIIAILMGLLLVAGRAVGDSIKRTQALHTGEQIVVAVKAYHTDYGAFPPLSVDGPTGQDIVVGDPSFGAPEPNNALFYTLRNIPSGPNQDHAANPQRTVYFEDKPAKVNAKGVARTGFFDRTATGATPAPDKEICLYDPWGRQYGIVIDGNGDDRIDLNGYYTDFSGAQTPGGRAPRWKAGAFSVGKDELLGTKGDRTYRRSGSETSDDVISWE